VNVVVRGWRVPEHGRREVKKWSNYRAMPTRPLLVDLFLSRFIESLDGAAAANAADPTRSPSRGEF
jgi:hypothetical protein